MQEHFFEERGLRYRTNAFMPGRQTLVFVHGLVGSASAWSEYEKYFEADYNVLTFDMRGHGMSKKWRHCDDYSLKEFSQDIFELISLLGIKEIILIGHSFATLVVFEFLVAHQDIVESAVFLSPSFSLKRSGRTQNAAWLPSIGAQLIEYIPTSLKIRGRTDYTKYKNSKDWHIWRTIADTHNTSIRTWLYAMKNAYEVDYESFLDQITIPILIIHGRNDSMFPLANSFAMEKKIRNAKLIVLENTDHIIVLNNAKEVTAAIQSFVKRYPSPRGKE